MVIWTKSFTVSCILPWLLSSLSENRLIYVTHKDPDLERNTWQTSQVRGFMAFWNDDIDDADKSS